MEVKDEDEVFVEKAIVRLRRERRAEKIRAITIQIGIARTVAGHGYNRITVDNDKLSAARMFDMVEQAKVPE